MAFPEICPVPRGSLGSPSKPVKSTKWVWSPHEGENSPECVHTGSFRGGRVPWSLFLLTVSRLWHMIPRLTCSNMARLMWRKRCFLWEAPDMVMLSAPTRLLGANFFCVLLFFYSFTIDLDDSYIDSSLNFNQPYIPGINLTWMYYLFIYYLIKFINICM